ncbi:hypothetical protein BC832DRAFT_540731 [Gaertneriomyces semiglobifer]|nr:hypothetical protein BC832DRAFT_540731 [Gaertneriomyces semiglobifer]
MSDFCVKCHEPIKSNKRITSCNHLYHAACAIHEDTWKCKAPGCDTLLFLIGYRLYCRQNCTLCTDKNYTLYRMLNCQCLLCGDCLPLIVRAEGFRCPTCDLYQDCNGTPPTDYPANIRRVKADEEEEEEEE